MDGDRFGEAPTHQLLTVQAEVKAILGGRPDIVGLAPASSSLDWIPGFLRSLRVEVKGHLLSEPPEDLAGAAQFTLRHMVAFCRCGASTERALFIPRRMTMREKRLVLVHELVHGTALRLGQRRNEADWWFATAAFVAEAATTPEGAALYPGWFIEAIPEKVWEITAG